MTEIELYFKLAEKPIFTFTDVLALFTDSSSARAALQPLLDHGYVAAICKDMYTAISAETRCPVANRFQIGSSITENSYISHHSAFEYHGVYNQVYYYVYVSSSKPFETFEFDGYTYIHVRSDHDFGIEEVEFSDGVRITDMERTIIDSVEDMDTISDPDEVMFFLSHVAGVNEDKLLGYLALCDDPVLYQKIGYLMKHCRLPGTVSSFFLDTCKAHKSNEPVFLDIDHIHSSVLDGEWNLYVPSSFLCNDEWYCMEGI